MRAIISICAVGLLGCSSAEPEVDNDLPPSLEMLSPQRGTFSESQDITVRGIVHDDQPGARVTVQGMTADVLADGSFEMTVTVAPGVSLIETHAIDSKNHDTRDIRAVLAGAMAPTDGSVKSQLGARLAPNGMKTVAAAIATAAEGLDFTTLAKAMNPVYNNDGCLGAKVDITSITLSNIDAALTPKAGALDTRVDVSNLVVKLHADFKVACIGGSTNITATATMAHVRDDMSIAVSAGKLKTAVPSPTVTLDGFTVDVGGVPSQIESLLRDKAREAAETRLATIIKDKVPGLADAKLAGLVAKPLSTSLLGHATTIGVTPVLAELATTGLFVAVDTTFKIAGGEGGTYLSNPMPISAALVKNAPNLGIAVADDLVNQLLGALWSAGAFDVTLAGDKVGIVAALLDDDVRSLDIRMSLPPTMRTDGSGLTLAVGDLIVTAKDDAGTAVQTFALSIETTMVAGPSGDHVILTTTTPIVKAQVLAQSAAVDDPIGATELEGIVTGVWGVVGGLADDALAKLPMPAIAGIQLGAPSIEGNAGYVVLDVH